MWIKNRVSERHVVFGPDRKWFDPTDVALTFEMNAMQLGVGEAHLTGDAGQPAAHFSC